MPAIKKSKSKSATSPAPATKPSRAPTKKDVVPLSAVAKSGGPAKAPSPEAAPKAAMPSPAPSAAAKPLATKPVVTTVRACIDVGFGNSLYARGEGAGLSWEKGVLMECRGQDQWQLSLGESTRPFLIKFLVNDTMWSTGPDYTVPAGVSLTLAPQF